MPHATPPGAKWRLRLLGAVDLESPDRRPIGLKSRTAARLLARLALWPQRNHPREELVELLWPGVDLTAGRNRLRELLSKLRTLLGGDERAPIAADRWELHLVHGRLACDVHDFEAAASTDHRLAATLYRGELMPGYYDEWILDERRRLAALHERLGRPRGEPAAAPTPPDDLPAYWTRAYGLERRVVALAQLVLAQRLVTVHGPGGAGKTRLAVAVAQSFGTPAAPAAAGTAGASFDRVAFVALAECRRSDDVLAAVAQALHAGSGSSAMAGISAALEGQRVLLVADNLEQLQPQADGLIEQLLLFNPRLHLLGTSRRLLGLPGETAFELQGLPLPAASAIVTDAAGVAAQPAVALLVDRARAACGGFALDERNADALAGLARLLGGLPLAIELAASRLRSHAPAELLERLRSQAGSPMLELLARPGAHGGHRHASMRDLLAWSWNQLDPPAAAFLGALSVLTAPAGAELAAAVAGCSAADAAVRLAQLHDASLLVAEPAGHGRTRHLLLQPVREFAAERTSPADAAAARSRLRRQLDDWARAQGARRPPPAACEPAWPELAPHVLAAVCSAPSDGEALPALELAVALRPQWEVEALPLPAVQALEVALQQPVGGRRVPTQALRARVHELLALGRLMSGFGAEALGHARQALALADDAGSRSLALVRLALTRYHCGELDADFDRPLAEAVGLAHDGGEPFAEAIATRALSLIRCNVELRFDVAEALLSEAQALFERGGHGALARQCLLGRSVMWAGLRHADEGLSVQALCEVEAQAQGDWQGAMHIARQNGRLQLRAHRWPEAVAAFGRSLDAAWRHGHTLGAVHALLHLPDGLALLAQPAQAERAARIVGFAAATWQRLYGPLNAIEAFELDRTRRLLRRSLGAGPLEALRTQGVAMSLPEAVALGLEAVRACAASPSSAPARRPRGPTGWRALRSAR